MALETEGFIVIETGPLAGTEPTIVRFDKKGDAFVYTGGRVHLFARTEVAKVLVRTTVEMVPRLVTESDVVPSEGDSGTGTATREAED